MRITENDKLRFKMYLFDNERSSATIKKYMYDIQCLEIFAIGRKIDKQLMLEYKEELGKKYEKSSANSMLAAANTFLKFIGESNCTVRRFRVQKQVYCDENKELSYNEYIRLVKAAERNRDERLSLILQTICSSGIRVSELPCFTVEALKKGSVTITCKGKTRSAFIVSKLKAKLLKYIRKHRITEGVIFKTKSGKPVDRSNIWREMKKLCRSAGVSPDKVFPHNLRHLFARVYYKVEKDIAKLADLLGHSSIDTTRIYIISTGYEHRCQMEKMKLII